MGSGILYTSDGASSATVTDESIVLADFCSAYETATPLTAVSGDAYTTALGVVVDTGVWYACYGSLVRDDIVSQSPSEEGVLKDASDFVRIDTTTTTIAEFVASQALAGDDITNVSIVLIPELAYNLCVSVDDTDATATYDGTSDTDGLLKIPVSLSKVYSAVDILDIYKDVVFTHTTLTANTNVYMCKHYTGEYTGFVFPFSYGAVGLAYTHIYITPLWYNALDSVAVTFKKGVGVLEKHPDLTLAFSLTADSTAEPILHSINRFYTPDTPEYIMVKLTLGGVDVVSTDVLATDTEFNVEAVLSVHFTVALGDADTISFYNGDLDITSRLPMALEIPAGSTLSDFTSSRVVAATTGGVACTGWKDGSGNILTDTSVLTEGMTIAPYNAVG